MGVKDEPGESIFSDLEEYADIGDDRTKLQRTYELWRETLAEQWGLLKQDALVVFGIVTIAFFAVIAVIAPLIAPHDPLERQYGADGILISQWFEPFWLGGEGGHLLGTTAEGYDIFSQLIFGTRPALIVGFAAAVITATVGTMVALTAGYYGGRTDDVLMRIVDIAYGLPLLPTVILMVAYLGPNFFNVIIAVCLLQWRSSARVIRSQVLSLRERPFVQSARVAGASDWRIISRHIAPNVLPLTFLYAAFAIGWGILTEAGVSFLGLGDPSQVSWGTMLQSAHTYNAMSFGTWWWFVPPGICIALVVISGFLIGRGYEEITNPKLRKRH
ncbi:ABC transporter permease subunit [Halorubrum sp. JWXQ-INN 858]|uniref:ABC transporter permease n=1 Tax=Halorubrum sp. JWXQ-INN 858 TaxID=2690782 RepID=UPI001356F2B0|nr:ABC transporter permease [Halorubrum sp. JWXQ-INN 858]MWV63268.1 ABC transporter permease subunit [Halorubrum sp. JWXQ-INN 858]